MTIKEFIHTLSTMQMLALDTEAEIFVDGKPLKKISYHLDESGNGNWDFTSDVGGE